VRKCWDAGNYEAFLGVCGRRKGKEKPKRKGKKKSDLSAGDVGEDTMKG